jgi:hypothetical protein
MRLCPPRRDDAPFAVVFIRIDHRDFQTVHEPDGIDANFSVIETMVRLLDGRTPSVLKCVRVENPGNP